MEEEKSMPLIGEKFPDMEVQTTHGRKKLPEEYKGKWFVLFSHPADFKTNDEHGVAIPANWPNNELIGDEVIIPPASDEQTAKERVKQYECYDWWFCHKKQ
jgi:alkyl hydroperoxide reductase subunit AhpC